MICRFWMFTIPKAFMQQSAASTMHWLTADVPLLQGVFVRQKKVMPRALTPRFFSDRIANIDNATSAAMYHALQGANLLDLHDKLLADPR